MVTTMTLRDWVDIAFIVVGITWYLASAHPFALGLFGVGLGSMLRGFDNLTGDEDE
jgi:hypothetical protein